MRGSEEWNPDEGGNWSWEQWMPVWQERPVSSRGRNRLYANPHLVVQRERETRRLLAGEIYRVPEAWLDDVLRVRMADLER